MLLAVDQAAQVPEFAQPMGPYLGSDEMGS